MYNGNISTIWECIVEILELSKIIKASSGLKGTTSGLSGVFLPKDPWPRVLSLPERFIGDPASLARDNF